MDPWLRAEPMSLVVRNTFIDAVPGDDDELDPPPNRTRSDPTGGRSQVVMDYARIQQPATIPLWEGTRDQEAGDADEDDDDGGEQNGEDEDDAEEDEEEDDGVPLARTVSTAYPAGLYMRGGNSTPLGAALERLASVSSENGLTRASSSLQRTVTGGGEDNLLGGGLFAPGLYHPDMMMGPIPVMNPWAPPYFMAPYGPFNAHAVPFVPGQAASGAGEEDGHEASTSSAIKVTHDMASYDPDSSGLPPLGLGAPIGLLHDFHQETRNMGAVMPDFRQFTKVGYEGRLSVISESRVHTDGVHRYLVQFTSGELSRADGVGFVFSQRLPCAKNIQRIVSIFVNQRGRICLRVFADIVRASAYCKPLELGEWVEMAIDLDKKVATFNIWPCNPDGWPPVAGTPSSTAVFNFGSKLTNKTQGGQKPVKLNVGHLACVVKNVGVTVTIGS